MLNRRDIFGATVAVAVAAAPAASANVSVDARIIELGQAYEAAYAEYVNASLASSRAFNAAKSNPSCANPALDPANKACEAREDALYQQVCDLERAILKTPCRSIEGYRVKALVAHNNRGPTEGMDMSEEAAFAVVDYLLGRNA